MNAPRDEADLPADLASGPAAVRSRHITWTDPAAAARQGLTMSGLEYLKAMQRGDLSPSPIARLMDIEIDEVEKGMVRFSLTPQEFHYNPVGSVHGGVAMTLLDSAMACAGLSTLDPRHGCATAELKVNLLSPLRVGTGAVVATGRVLHGSLRSPTAGRVEEAG